MIYLDAWRRFFDPIHVKPVVGDKARSRLVRLNVELLNNHGRELYCRTATRR
jgi:hypothetical protein